MKKNLDSNAPIGVFDSGLGGLTVVRELRKKLPKERIVYFGDLARLPYGSKSEKQIRIFSVENTDFLLKLGVKALVVACNSSSGAAFTHLKNLYSIPVIDVITPAAREAARVTHTRRIGIIATQTTIATRAYDKALHLEDETIHVFSNSCPLLVPFVEEGMIQSEITEIVLRKYLNPLLLKKIDTLILGCTHYPLLFRLIRKVVGKHVQLVHSAPACVLELTKVLRVLQALRVKGSSSGSLEAYVTDSPQNFEKIGARFLGETLGQVKMVHFEGTVLQNGRWVQ
jgi:glutamate racemase